MYHLRYMSGSSTIRVPRRANERLERFAKITGSKKLLEAFKFPLSTAERETETFHGNIEPLVKARKSVRSVGGGYSDNADEAFAEGPMTKKDDDGAETKGSQESKWIF